MPHIQPHIYSSDYRAHGTGGPLSGVFLKKKNLMRKRKQVQPMPQMASAEVEGRGGWVGWGWNVGGHVAGSCCGTLLREVALSCARSASRGKKVARLGVLCRPVAGFDYQTWEVALDKLREVSCTEAWYGMAPAGDGQ